MDTTFWRDVDDLKQVRIGKNAEMYSGDSQDGYRPGDIVTILSVRTYDGVLKVQAEDGHIMYFYASEIEEIHLNQV